MTLWFKPFSRKAKEAPKPAGLALVLPPAPTALKLVTIMAKANMVYTPDRWNGEDQVKKANCYAYAMDEPALEWAWFGHRTRPTHEYFDAFKRAGRDISWTHPAKTLMHKDMKAPAIKELLLHHDGFERIRKHAFDPAKHHIVAYSNYLDHFFRLDGNGMWSHKPGQNPATNLDQYFKPIADLEAADIHLTYKNNCDRIDIAYYRMRPGQNFTWVVQPRRPL